MNDRSICPDFSTLQIPMDIWSEPFWQAGAEGRVMMPRCNHCGTLRWPAGPFCPECHTQAVEWVSPGRARLYSFTVLSVQGVDKEAPPQSRMPALVVFDDAPGVRLVSVLVDADPNTAAIDMPVDIVWKPAANAVVPVFRLTND